MSRSQSRKEKVAPIRPRMRRLVVEQLESRKLLAVTYHGGQLLSNVEVQAAYLGSDWSTNSALSTQKANVEGFLSYIVQSPYMDMMTQAGYNVARGTADVGVVDNLTLNKSAGITDFQIQRELQALVRSSQLTTPDANRLYVVFVEPGVAVTDGASSSATSFLGYHGAFAGTDAAGKPADLHYAVIPYPGSPNPSSSSQGFASVFDEVTSVTTHELSEAVTDPNVNYKQIGWYDDQRNGEIGDLTRRNSVLNGYVVQDIVAKNGQSIRPVVTAPPSSLAAPQNVVATPLSSTSARISWSSVPGAQGYRVFLVDQSQSTLVDTVGASATSLTVTDLKAGTSESFRVEAYSGSTVADSNLVTVIMPKPSPLTAPTATSTALSATQVSLSWNSVAGAEGYRIFMWDGARSVLLGTVGASTTSVRVSNLTGGSTVSFLIQAYQGVTVADSNWTTVTTPVPRTWSIWWPRWWF